MSASTGRQLGGRVKSLDGRRQSQSRPFGHHENFSSGPGTLASRPLTGTTLLGKGGTAAGWPKGRRREGGGGRKGGKVRESGREGGKVRRWSKGRAVVGVDEGEVKRGGVGERRDRCGGVRKGGSVRGRAERVQSDREKAQAAGTGAMFEGARPQAREFRRLRASRKSARADQTGDRPATLADFPGSTASREEELSTNPLRQLVR